MKPKILIIPFVLIFLLVAACSGGETATPEPTEAIINTPEPTNVPMADVQLVPIEDVQNILWQWSSLVESEPAAQSVVPNPENYTLELRTDSTFSAKADCNNIAGTYQVSDGFLTLSLGPSTLAECGSESLFNQYQALLGSVATFGLREGTLVLGLREAAGEMRFTNAGPSEMTPTPTPEACDAGIDPATVNINTQGLSDEFMAECVYATPYNNTQPPGPVGLPDNVQVYFSGTTSQSAQPEDPVVYIIPVADYVSLWQANGDETIAQSVQALRDLLLKKPDLVTVSEMPVLPYPKVNAVSDLQVQAQYLNIQMGMGVRFVTRFSQGLNPVTKDNPPLFYTFQGFSSDGLYLITFFYPVTTESLPASSAVTPEEQQMVDNDYQAYLDGRTDTLNKLAASDWVPNLETLDAMIASLKYGEAIVQSSNPLTNINWQWFSLTETDPASQTVVPDPENYTLVFFNNGALSYQADCNSGSGTYSLSGDQITISLGISTLVECGEKSLSAQYVSLLGTVANYGFETGNLILGLKDDAGSMGFAYAGDFLDTIPPAPGVPTATTTDALNVRSGPGTDYYSFGVVPAGTTFEVVGVNAEKTWLAVKIPSSVTLSGVGWISADYAETQNIENVPVLPAPPLVTPTLKPTDTALPAATETPEPTETIETTETPQP